MMDIQNLLLKGGSQNDTVLFDQDIIVIPFRQYIVYVGGQVTSPGAYPYIVNKTWDYYVGLAGGFNIDNHIGTGVRITDVYGSRYKKDERIIQPEDVIYAPLNHPLYWLREYGTDIALITTTIISTIVMINYIGSLDIPTPATE
jgi:polysaccharide export outer membrane protein